MHQQAVIKRTSRSVDIGKVCGCFQLSGKMKRSYSRFPKSYIIICFSNVCRHCNNFY